MIGGGAVQVRRLQLHLAGSNGCVELYLCPVHDVEHQADADDDLQRKEEEVTMLCLTQRYTQLLFLVYLILYSFFEAFIFVGVVN